MPKTLLAELGKLTSCSACPIAVSLLNSLAMGQVVMLHATAAAAAALLLLLLQ